MIFTKHKLELRCIKANMTEVTIGDNLVLFSYNTPVAYYKDKVGWFKTSKKWSQTTAKHINSWLNGHKALELPQRAFDFLLEISS